MRRSGKMKIAAALLLCSTVVLGACGSESSQNKETAKVTEAAGTAASTELAAGEPEKQEDGLTGELNIFVHVGSMDINPVIEKMQQENSDLKINLEMGSGTQYETVLKTKLSAGEAPDIMTVWPGSRTADYAAKGYLEKLTEEPWAARIPATINSEFSLEDDLYAMCFTVGGEGLIYNQDLFDQYNLSVPQNFDELLNVCETFQKNGVQPFASGYKDDWVIMRYTNSAFATLGYGREPDFDKKLASGELDFSYPGWVELFDKYGVLLDKHYFGDAILSTDSSQAIADFATGKTAMMIHTSSTISEIRKVSPDMKLGLTATPVNNAGEELYANWKSGLGFAVSSKSKNKEAAKRFLEIWADPEVNEALYHNNGEPTILNDVPSTGTDPALQDFYSKFVSTEKFALGAHDRWPAGMSNNWKKKLQEFVGRQINTEQMIDWLNEEYQSMK